MIINEAYIALKSYDLTDTHAAYSRNFLGRSDRYYDYLVCSGAEPSIEALTALAVRLSRLTDLCRTSGGPSTQVDALHELCSKAQQEIERRSLAALPSSRPRRPVSGKLIGADEVMAGTEASPTKASI